MARCAFARGLYKFGLFWVGVFLGFLFRVFSSGFFLGFWGFFFGVVPVCTGFLGVFFGGFFGFV